MAKTFIAIILFLVAATSINNTQAAAPKKQLSWAELSVEQQQLLEPLSSGWDDLDASRKRKWLGIAKRYPTMKPSEQENVRKRMQDWASLTPQQRQAARDRFRKLEKLPPEKKQSLTDKWEEYQQLPESERERLRALERNRKVSSTVDGASASNRSNSAPKAPDAAR